MSNIFICCTKDCAIALSNATFPGELNCPVCKNPLELVINETSISDGEIELIGNLPYVIAFPLKRTLEEKHPWTKINFLKDTFLNYLKYLGLLTASEFFNSDLKNRRMVDAFQKNLAQPSFGSWNAFIRECIAFLKEQNHSFFYPELVAYYELIETGSKRKLYKGEIEYIDSNGDVQLKKLETTAIGLLINFRNRYLGHGLTLDEQASQQLWNEYFPVFKLLLEQMSFSKDYPMLKREHGETYILQGTELKEINSANAFDGSIWIENKQGEAFDILPFYIVPGALALAKEDKEQVLSYESFTGKTIKFFSPEGSEKQTSGVILEKLNLLLRNKLKETAYSPETFTKDVFLSRIAEENKLVLDTLKQEKKVIEGIYQHRETIEIKLREWIGARTNIFFIAAEAGSGKTNLLVEIQKQYTERQLPSLFIRAARMEKSSLKEQIAYQLNLDTIIDLKEYKSIAGTQADPTFILIDGLNEARNAEAIWFEILETSTLFEPGSLKFVITNRANSNLDLERYTLTDVQELFIYSESKEHHKEKGIASHVFWLTPMDMVEMEGAWEFYVKKDKKRFKPLFSFNDLASFDRGLYLQINNPLVLRIFLETYQGKDLPEKGVKHLHIWKDWFATFTELEQKFMRLLADTIWEKGENEIELEALCNDEQLKTYILTDNISGPYHRLLNLGWVSRYHKDLTIYVSFTVEGVLLYLLGVKLDKQIPEITVSDIHFLISNGTKLQKSGIEFFLCEKALKGELDLISELIDEGEEKLMICITPLLYYLKLYGVEDTIQKLLVNQTENDWICLSLLRIEIKRFQLHSILVQFDRQIFNIKCKDIFFQYELLKLSCLEFFTAENKLLEIDKILLEQKFTEYDEINKIKYLFTLVEIICEVSPNKTIDIYESYLKTNHFNKKVSLALEYLQLLLNIGDSYYCLPNRIDDALEIFFFGDGLITDKRNFDFNSLKLSFQNSIACCKVQQKKYKESELIFKKLIIDTKKLLGEKHSFFIMVYTNYSELLRLLNRFEESELLLLKCLDIADEVEPESSATFNNIYNSLGWNYISKISFDKAIECFERCIIITKKIFGSKNIKTANSYNNLGVAYQHIKDSENALVNYLKATEVYNINEYENPTTISNIGSIYFEKNEYEIALNYFNKAIQIQPDNSLTIRKIALVYFKLNNVNEAFNFLNQSEQLLLKIDNESNKLELSFLYSNYSKFYEELEIYDKSIEYCIKTIDVYLELFDKSHDYIITAIYNLAELYYYNGEFENAIINYNKRLLYAENDIENNDEIIANLYYDIANSYFELKQFENAMIYYKNTYKTLVKGGVPFQIAKCYEELNDKLNALDFYIQSAEIRKEDPEVGLEAESTQKAISNALRLAKELDKENELPEWMKNNN